MGKPKREKSPYPSARLNYIRVSPRKVRLVADLVRGRAVEEACTILKYTNKKSAPYLLKLLRSAQENARTAKRMDADKLFVKTICVDAGFTMKRWQPRAMGRATPLLKRTSKVTVILDEIGRQ